LNISETTRDKATVTIEHQYEIMKSETLYRMATFSMTFTNP